MLLLNRVHIKPDDTCYSSEDLAQALIRHWRYRRIHQRGSHIVLETDEPGHQRLAIPAHDPLRVGTLNAILRAVAQHKGCERADILKAL